MDEVRRLDDPWTMERIIVLLQGEALRVLSDAAGRQLEVVVEGPSAYELVCKALDGGNQELLHDVIQLEQAIRQLPDDEVRHLLRLIVRMGDDPYSACELLKSLGLRSTSRDAMRMQSRGAELVRRHEHRRKTLLSRVRARSGSGDAPVCWRCLKADVLRIGDDCGPECPALKPPPKTGRPRKWDWSGEAPKGLTPEQREEEIAYLAKTQPEQQETNWPGERNRRRHEMLSRYGKLPEGH